jgi:death on curing protein
VSAPLTHLTASAVKAIHAEVLAAHGGLPGIRDEALLEAAVSAPQATMMGRPLLSNPVEMAAAYLFYLCRNHPFIDENKRSALAACLIFLEANDLLPSEKLSTAEWEVLVVDVAEGGINRDQTTARLRRLLKQLPRATAKRKKYL